MMIASLAAAMAIDGAGFDAGAFANAQITGFAIDHRKVAPGTVFGAFSGARVNGEDFIAAAIAAGAVAVVTRPGVTVEGAAHFTAEEPRRLFALLAAQFYRPVPDTLVAVTGTNGKTSTVEMVRQIWRRCGHHAASIGTLGITTADESVSTGLTTPDIVTFLQNLSGLEREGVTHVAYEASSHGLSQYRSEGVQVAAGAFTNLSRDHLDYHATMDDYFAAKMRLFSEVVKPGGTAVIWADDPWSDQAIAVARAAGLTVMAVGEKGDGLRLLFRNPIPLGQGLVVEHQGVEYQIKLPLIGAYQTANALVAAGLAIASGEDPARVFENLSMLQPVRGRLERAAITSAGVPIYVDYAHTPEAIIAAVDALRPHLAGQLHIVFGAGGDRDSGKRGPMGAVAAAHADHAIVTDDNPRGEDPAAIRAAIMAEAPGAREIADRREAICAAIAAAQPGDIVLIAGKGHEQGQIIGAGEHMRVLPFDDVTVARECAALNAGDAQ